MPQPARRSPDLKRSSRRRAQDHNARTERCRRARRFHNGGKSTRAFMAPDRFGAGLKGRPEDAGAWYDSSNFCESKIS